MAFSWTDIANGEIGSSIRTKLNTLGNQVTLLNLKMLTFTNVTVATSAWASNSTYANYPYRAMINCSGMLATDIPLVKFAPTQQESGIYVGADSTANGVYIYASSIPTASITIPLVMGLRVVS